LPICRERSEKEESTGLLVGDDPRRFWRLGDLLHLLHFLGLLCSFHDLFSSFHKVCKVEMRECLRAIRSSIGTEVVWKAVNGVIIILVCGQKALSQSVKLSSTIFLVHHALGFNIGTAARGKSRR
jgi:hypothetical protein